MGNCCIVCVLFKSVKLEFMHSLGTQMWNTEFIVVSVKLECIISLNPSYPKPEVCLFLLEDRSELHYMQRKLLGILERESDESPSGPAVCCS